MENTGTGLLKRGLAHLRSSLKLDRSNGGYAFSTENTGDTAFNHASPDGVATLARKVQAIYFEPIPDKMYGEGDFVIKAVSSSGLPVSFTASWACSVSGNIVHIKRSGECTVIAHQAGDDSYEPAPAVSNTFAVRPAKLTVKADDKSVVYGAPLPVFTATISGLVNGMEHLGSLAFTTAAVRGSPVGSYTITPAGLTSPDYDYTYIEGTLKVTPAPLTVTADNKSVLYGNEPPVFTATVMGLVNGDTVESLGNPAYDTPFTPGKSVGTYPIKVGGLSSANYESSYIEGTLTVMPAPLTVTVEDKTAVYGAPLPDFTAAIIGLVNSDTLESIGKLDLETPASPGSPVAVYSIKASGLATPNYAITYVDGTLNITPASLIVTAEDKRMVFGTPLPDFSAAVSGLVNGDTVKSLGDLAFTTSAAEGSPLGTYVIKPGGLTSPNYAYTYIEGMLAVTPARLKVIVEDKSMVSGGPLPTFSAVASGLVNGDTLASLGALVYETTATPDSPPGDYAIKANGLSSPNYEFSYIEGTLTVTPQPKAMAAEDNVKETPLPGLINKTTRLGQLLVDDGVITPQDLVTALSKQLEMPIVDLNTYKIGRESLKLVSESLARKYNVIPLAVCNGYLAVAMSDPTDILAIEALSAQTKMRIKPRIALAGEIQKAIDRNYESFVELGKQFVDVKTKAEVRTTLLNESIAEAPAVRALDIIVEEAIKNRASDIHIEPEADKVRLRYRIDGVMHEVASLSFSAHAPLISRLKVLANINIADHRPQDGQFNFKAWEKEVDIRVATIATTYGEMGTLRILDRSFAVRTLTEVGFLTENLKQYEKMLKSPFGMILISGPTGSGKTTTLYASINSLDCKEMKIITIEDPVEYHFEGINQIQVNPRAGLTFSNGLRAIMRHDPDVALVGEIRDSDTATVAVQAAMTGHLVMASVHANDSVGVLFRLLDLGIEPFLLASALVGVVAQRMVRRICPNCRDEAPVSVECQVAYLEEMGGEPRESFAYGKGCQLCANTGYLGRTVVFELMTMSDEIRRLLLTGAGTAQLRAQAIKEGMVPMRHDGMLKVKDGVTTPNEILRNVFSI